MVYLRYFYLLSLIDSLNTLKMPRKRMICLRTERARRKMRKTVSTTSTDGFSSSSGTFVTTQDDPFSTEGIENIQGTSTNSMPIGIATITGLEEEASEEEGFVDTNDGIQVRSVGTDQENTNDNADVTGPYAHAPFISRCSRNLSAYTGTVFDGNRCTFCSAYRFSIEPQGLCCSMGKVSPPQLPSHPVELLDLFTNEKFMQSIRYYNNLFALASLGCQEVKRAGYSPTVQLQGKVYHVVDSLLPEPSASPTFAQLYFYDPSNELRNRLSLSDQVDEKIVESIQNSLHKHNRYVKELKKASSLCSDGETVIDIVFSDDGPDKTYARPSSDQVAAVASSNFSLQTDIQMTTSGGARKRISDLNPMYDPLHYVLLFPFGSHGYHFGVKRSNGSSMSILDFYCYHLQIRDQTISSNLILRSRRLTQQYVCDQFIKIEKFRLRWFSNNQKQIRAEKYQGFMDAIDQQDDNSAQAIGKRVILPPGHYGSPRWYAKCFQDCMAIVRTFGKPDLFITFTCNPEWAEIRDSIGTKERPGDRPDICVRVFHAKLRILLRVLIVHGIFGKVAAYTCMVEYQKRGLPHAHTLIIFAGDDKIRDPDQVDRIISAEIPHEEKNPKLYSVVTKNMVHGPCGQLNPGAICTKSGKKGDLCSKYFPKKANNNETVINTSLHYPEYKRRDVSHGGNLFTKMVRGKQIKIDNMWIVPYSPILSEMFEAHINVEVVMHIGAVKYLYKYVTKGTDKIMFNIENKYDEIENFQVGRFVSATEAFWRLYQFKINFKKPIVQRLPIHLENEQLIYFQMNNIDDAIDAGEPQTELLGYFDLNKSDPSARKIMYPDIVHNYIWNKRDKCWRKRKVNVRLQKSTSDKLSDAIGRIPLTNLNPKQEELYYLRICLYHISGAESYEDLRTVNGIRYPTFKEACVALGVLEDDREFHKALDTAATVDFGNTLRELFATILAHGSPLDPVGLWNEHKKSICFDYVRSGTGTREYTNQDFNRALCEVQKVLDGFGLHLTENFGIPFDASLSDDLILTGSEQERFDYEELKRISNESIERLTEDQRSIFDIVLRSVDDTAGRCFAIDAPGGAGKSTVITTLLATVRARGQLAIATAISGIAATLLPEGRTLHSTMKVPIELDESSVCHITPKDRLSEVLRNTKLLVVDEVTMAHKYVYEAIDRTLRDILKPDMMFGGLTVLLAGDWRQILPVIPRGGKAEILNACLKNSYLWPNIEMLRLTKNMRLMDNPENAAFADYLLAVGEGRIKPVSGSLDDIEIPERLCLTENSVQSLCEFVFQGEHWEDISWLVGRAVLAPTNEAAGEINDYMIDQLPGQETEYLSADSVIEETGTFTEFPPEFVNAVRLQGVAPHKLRMKPGCPIMLLRNLDPVNSHCNGSRYIVKQTHQHLVEATVASRKNVGLKKLIPRIPMISKDSSLPFRVKRVQFPVRLSFAMTMNKAQGQSLSRLGIYLSQDVFSHGQLYVALSRVRDSSNIRILTRAGRKGIMRNVVYPEVLKH